MDNKLLGPVLGAVLGACAVLAFYHAAPAQKPNADPSTPKATAGNDCATRAYQDYLKDQLALGGDLSKPDVTKLLSIETTLARRRLQERFCLQFANCLADSSQQGDATSLRDTAFSSCLRDEALEEYDAVPREEANQPD
jgi:hypothetical protein